MIAAISQSSFGSTRASFASFHCGNEIDLHWYDGSKPPTFNATIRDVTWLESMEDTYTIISVWSKLFDENQKFMVAYHVNITDCRIKSKYTIDEFYGDYPVPFKVAPIMKSSNKRAKMFLTIQNICGWNHIVKLHTKERYSKQVITSGRVNVTEIYGVRPDDGNSATSYSVIFQARLLNGIYNIFSLNLNAGHLQNKIKYYPVKYTEPDISPKMNNEGTWICLSCEKDKFLNMKRFQRSYIEIFKNLCYIVGKAISPCLLMVDIITTPIANLIIVIKNVIKVRHWRCLI